MVNSNDSLWLAITRDTGQIYLLEYERLQALASTLSSNTQPTLIALIGARARYRAFRGILPGS